MPVQALTPEDVEAVKLAMLDGVARRVGVKGKPMSARSVNLTVGTLRQALGQAVRRQKVTRNVADLVDLVAGDTRPGAAWAPGEADTFKAVASRDRLHAAWLLSCCGLRRGEVLGLEWDRDIDLDERTVTIAVSRTSIAGQARGLDTHPGAGNLVRGIDGLSAFLANRLTCYRIWITALTGTDGNNRSWC